MIILAPNNPGTELTAHNHFVPKHLRLIDTVLAAACLDYKVVEEAQSANHAKDD